MIIESPLDNYLVGAGLVIGAQDRINAIAVGSNVRFVDSIELPVLRATNPDWRSRSLAPVELLDHTGELTQVPDASVQFVCDWSIATNAKLGEKPLHAASRVLSPGGVLVLLACDSRFVEGNPERMFEGLNRLAERLLSETVSELNGNKRWSFSRFAMVIAALVKKDVSFFELELIQRYGRYNFALLRRCASSPIQSGSVVTEGGNFYGVEGPYLRRVADSTTLGVLRTSDVPIIEICAAERALFIGGPPLLSCDVTSFLAKMDLPV